MSRRGCRGCCQYSSSTCIFRSGGGKDLPGRWRRGIEIRMIEDVKNFPAELHIEPVRDAGNRGVLEQGEIQVSEPGPDHRVSSGIAEKIRTIDLAGRRRAGRSCKSRTLRRKGVWRGWEDKAVKVEISQVVVLEIRVDRIAPGRAVRKCIEICGLKAKWVAGDDGREGQATGHRQNFAKLPARGRPFCGAVPGSRPGNIPDRADYPDVSNVEIGKSATLRLIKEGQARNGISKRVAGDSR